ncbi:hypothetical protein ACDF64_02935 [Agromyces sp. MMS24-JH15]|uniref:hypothetical protein n=1 Tax=Agromyces sp. MMS24-JH15 TaxID=3243765 RepID=UPI00374786B9
MARRRGTGPDPRGGRTAAAVRVSGSILITAAIALALTGCAELQTVLASTSGTPSPSPSAPALPASSPAEPELPSVVAWASGAEWSWSDDGLAAPVAVTFTKGRSTDAAGGVTEVVDAVLGDANADGVEDAAIRARRTAEAGVTELWYVWLGIPGASPGTAMAEQVVYPIARTIACGDLTDSVTAISGGFRIIQTLRLPYTDDGLRCSAPGSGRQVRDVAIERFEDAWYPVQTAPVPAWGGICPRTTWHDGLADIGLTLRAAAPASAPAVTDPLAPLVTYELPDAPLLAASGARFFGFAQAETNDLVRQQCAFY